MLQLPKLGKRSPKILEIADIEENTVIKIINVPELVLTAIIAIANSINVKAEKETALIRFFPQATNIFVNIKANNKNMIYEEREKYRYCGY